MTAGVKVHFRLNRRVLDDITRSPNGMVGRGVQRLGRIAEARARENILSAGRVDTGEMFRTTYAEPVKQTGRGVTVSVVSTQPYARFQEWGTRWITAAHFMSDALDSLDISDFTGGA